MLAIAPLGPSHSSAPYREACMGKREMRNIGHVDMQASWAHDVGNDKGTLACGMRGGRRALAHVQQGVHDNDKCQC